VVCQSLKRCQHKLAEIGCRVGFARHEKTLLVGMVQFPCPAQVFNCLAPIQETEVRHPAPQTLVPRRV